MQQQALTQRDIELVVTLYKFRYLKTPQIRELHFPSEQTANRRLRSLTAQGLVKYFTVGNVPERIYYITRKGAQLVADQLGVTLTELKWSQHSHIPKDYYFMRHFLGINQFRIDITKACDASAIELLGFIPEYFGKQHAGGRITKHITDFVLDGYRPGEKLNHTPDAVLALMKSGKAALFFLEIDRGTEMISNPEKGFLKMVRFYAGYAETQKYKIYEQEFNCRPLNNFRLLTVTTSQKRLENMRRAATSYCKSLPALRYFWVTTFDSIAETDPLQQIWLSLQSADDKLYAIG